MKEKKIINILMWIPIMNFFIGVYEMSRMIKGGTWFERVTPLMSVLNGMYVGAGLSLILFYFILN